MAPHDDLTAERADLKKIARKLVLQINEITPAQWDKHDDKGQAIVLAALLATRQEALREALRDVLEVLGLLDAALTPSVSEMDIFAARKLIKETIARLASEGG